jgi:hypothetical protein
MRDRLVLALIVVTLGTLFTCPLAFGQEQPTPKPAAEPLTATERTVTVAGRVLGEPPLQNAEVLAVMLLPGWSETLSSDIAAGTAPMVTLQSGRMERVVAAPSGVDQQNRRTVTFEFRNVPPGEYQPVAVRIKPDAESGAAIAEGVRLIVADRDIADVELEVTALPLDQSGKRHGGAEDREAAVLDPAVRRRIDIDVAQPGPIRRPIGPAGPGRFPPVSTSSGSTKKDILSHILFGLSVAAAVFVVTR